jgi:hypothetical protein
MRFTRLQNLTLALSLVALFALVAITAVPVAHAQTNTTGAVVGIVSDSSGAFVAGAKVTVTNQATGASYNVVTSPVGDYRVSQLAPGKYIISVEAKGFERSKQYFDISAGTVGSANVTLSVGNTSVTVEVDSGEVALLHVDDAQLSTAFTEDQIQTLPNPGNDLTFIAQTAPGSVMNTQSEYGNFSSYGLPGTANSFTINGGYDNDPFLNISNSGASNLALGANDISVETVTSNAYNASFGGLGGSQVSEISRSGGNQFHGNVNYQWNGRAMNANDFFNKMSGSPRAFDNANQYAGAIGGPIKRDKAFFFVNYEGLRVILPSRATVYAPDASYQALVLANLATNGLNDEIPIYTNIFNLYTKAPGYSTGTVPTGGSDADNNGYGVTSFNATASNFTHEYLVNPRIDWNISDKDHLFGHATIDKGVQATYTNVLNPVYDALSAQPSYQGQLGETHTFSPMLSNQFLFSMIYYVAVFSNANEAASEDPTKGGMPFSVIFADTLLSNNPGAAFPGGENFEWPQGRNVTGYQFQDDLSWTKGKHTLSVGWTMRRDDVTDYSPSEFTTSPEAYTTASSFQQGYVDYWQEQFPSRSTQPVALYDMGWYVQDQWKVMPNMTLTYGLRMEHNSNPICVTDCFAHLAGNFANAPTSNDTAYNQVINAGLHQAIDNLQVLGWEPRIGFAYLPFGSGSKTTVRGGFGMFADAFPGVIADDMLNNAPTNVPFTIYGPAFGGNPNTLVPSDPASAYNVAASSAAGFKTGFATGGSFNSISDSVAVFSPPSMINPKANLKYPTYEEWNLALEQQVSRFDSLSISYVGNRSYHEPELNEGINAFNGGGAAGFPELSTTSAPNPNFGAFTEISSSANGNFNGLVVSGAHRSKSLTVTFNYMWSHALDEISNGGFEPFTGSSIYPDDPSDLRKNYGNADYDTRQYVSASYVYTLPHFGGPKVLVDNWEASGTFFHSTGLPFSVTDTTTSSALTNYGSTEPLYARKVGSFSGTHCNGKAAAQGTPCSFVSNFTGTATYADGTKQTANYATDFGQSRRNQLFGPNYTDTDLTITKGFVVPGWQSAKVKVGASFFNLFNHPNFAQPQSGMSYCSASAINQGGCADLYEQTNSSLGKVLSAVNPPTSILGSFLGGDASPRLIQLVAKFQF